ncbi:hypothetical protein BN85301000 [Paracholeplasma brassicae]|uniref:Glycoside hydrolase family 42 N-terminal domain-containing protein n=2 Tax=Acholeplasma brassicae TaxID=61635 RepID=U4KM87_9MOLU|nr:hypothetical protein BN85301000 [Paracholeplasma brassicae]
MLIGAWIAPPHQLENLKSNFNTLEQYRLIKEAGINTIYGLYETPEKEPVEVLKAISYAKEVGISYLVRDPRIEHTTSSEQLNLQTKSYLKEAAGILVYDEPGIEQYKRLNTLYNDFKTLYPDKLFYVNLMPLHANQNQLYWGAWRGAEEALEEVDALRYYKDYIKALKLPYLSYDFYPFEGEFPSIRSDYFEQLKLIYELTKEASLIPICFIQTCSFNTHVRIPNKTEVLWQVNTSLAYGTKGIQYFTYFLPENNHLEQFKGAIINHEGKRTPLYEAVKDINQWVNQIGRYLIDAEVIEINHTEDVIKTTLNHKGETYLFYCNASLVKRMTYQSNINESIISQNQATPGALITLEPGEAILIKRSET